MPEFASTGIHPGCLNREILERGLSDPGEIEQCFHDLSDPVGSVAGGSQSVFQVFHEVFVIDGPLGFFPLLEEGRGEGVAGWAVGEKRNTQARYLIKRGACFAAKASGWAVSRQNWASPLARL